MLSKRLQKGLAQKRLSKAGWSCKPTLKCYAALGNQHRKCYPSVSRRSNKIYRPLATLTRFTSHQPPAAVSRQPLDGFYKT